MSSYIPKAEKSKRKRVEVVLVSSDKEMKKLLKKNPWVLDILELHLTDKQVESLETPTIIENLEINYFAHDLCDTIKKALKDLPLTGREFAKMRILRADGFFLFETELISHLGLTPERESFVCCKNISDVNIDVISDFAELLRGYLKSTELQEINRTRIISDSIEKDDIFTIGEKNERLPKTKKLFDVVKENHENLPYLPESIKQLFLKDEKIWKLFTELSSSQKYSIEEIFKRRIASFNSIKKTFEKKAEPHVDKWQDLAFIKEKINEGASPLKVWSDCFLNSIWNMNGSLHKFYNRDQLIIYFKELLPANELYRSALKILLDGIWDHEDYYLRIHSTVETLIFILFQKEGVPNKYEYLTITISDLNDRKYRKDLEKDIAFADTATPFLDRKTFRPDIGIDEDLINRIGSFLIELRSTVRNGDSSIYEKDEFIVSVIAHIMYHFKGPWKALKPLLLLFRAIPKQCVTLDQEVMLQERSVPWINIPWAITSIITRASKDEEDAKELRLNWFKDMTEKLKPVKEEKAERRNYETLRPEFKKGFAPALKEPHPLWRVIYCEAAADLKTSPGNKGRYVFDKVKESDPDEEVKDAAERTAIRVARIKDQFGEGSHKTALMNAWWWYRIGHIQSTGGKVDMDLAETIKSKEVRRNY